MLSSIYKKTRRVFDTSLLPFLEDFTRHVMADSIELFSVTIGK